MSRILKHGVLWAYASIAAVDANRRAAGRRGTISYYAVTAPKSVRYDATVKQEQPAYDRKEW